MRAPPSLLAGALLSAPVASFAQSAPPAGTVAPAAQPAPSPPAPVAAQPAPMAEPVSTPPPQPPPQRPEAPAPDPEVVRRACRAARSVDAFAWTTSAVLGATGLGLTIYALSVNTTPIQAEIGFLRAFSPGLILGAIGIPFARGAVVPVEDAFRGLCGRVLARGGSVPDDPRDTYAADAALRVNGGPTSHVITVLLAIATAGAIGGTVAALVLRSTDVAQVMGGIDGAAVAGWAFLVPTPGRTAALAYVEGRFNGRAANYAPRVRLQPLATALPGGAWWGVGGTF